MNNETHNAGPLERRVGRADGETTPDVHWIDNLDDEDLNRAIAKIFYSLTEEELNYYPWPIPEFVSDRNWSQAILTNIWSSSNEVRNTFENLFIDYAEKNKVKGGLIESMVVVLPKQICRLALKAIHLNNF